MVRTKQTGKKAVANGTASRSKTTTHTSPAASTPRPPSQPADLSETDRLKLKNWLDAQGPAPFSIATLAPSRKRKRTSTLQTQGDLWDERLNIQFEVKPRDKWECLRRYKKFTVGSESIATGQCILVKHDDSSDDARIDIPAQWKAKVLEVRALDSEHVYIRVAWLNRPEDLPQGREAFRGKNELIPTNQMDVIDAMAVNGSLELQWWDEADDEAGMVDEDTFFWRQTYDYSGTGKFSELRKICIDNAPQNPDEMILQCANRDCRKWLHVKCIAERAVQEAAEDTPSAKKQKKARPKDLSIGSSSSALAKAEKDSFVAEVFLKDLPDGKEHAAAKASEIVVTSSKGEQSSQDVCCLFCGTEIE